MAKIKIHELAKETGVSSKEVLAFLQEKGIEAKVAQSSVDEDAAALVKARFGGKAEPKGIRRRRPWKKNRRLRNREKKRLRKRKRKRPRSRKHLPGISRGKAPGIRRKRKRTSSL